MIKTQVKIHDDFSVEFKTGFLTNNKPKDINEFKINTWMFVPTGLDINSSSYTKDQFYQDIKRNIRLITPIYSLSEVLEEGRGPFVRLEKAISLLCSDSSDTAKQENFGYQIRMLLNIVKSAMMREAEDIVRTTNEPAQLLLIERYIKNIREIIESYREKYSIINGVIANAQLEYYLFGDNFLGNIVEQHLFFLLKGIKGRPFYETVKDTIIEILSSEDEHRRKQGYLLIDKDDDEKSSLVISQRNILKKFVESDLFLRIVKKKDGAIAEQVYYSFAAGLAMIVATIISNFATLRYESYTTSLFIVLIVGYMLKDRIKDLARHYFATSMSKKYFDNKLKLSIRNQEIGWMKESFDFLGENKVPEEVLAMRRKSPRLDTEGKISTDQVILYRKWVKLSKEDIEKYKEYKLSGINDITRINLLSMTKKMDDPSVLLDVFNDNRELYGFKGTRVYPLYFVVQCQSELDEYYRAYRVIFNRKGIKSIEELD